MSFSAHADAKGIMQLIRTCEPKNVVLVHGENLKMDFLKDQIIKEFGIFIVVEILKNFSDNNWSSNFFFCNSIMSGIDCFKPANGESITVKTRNVVPANISVRLLKNEISQSNQNQTIIIAK